MENEDDYVYDCDHCKAEFATEAECDLHERDCHERPMFTRVQKLYAAILVLFAAFLMVRHRLPDIRCMAENGVTLGPVHVDKRLANLGVMKAADGWRIDRVETTRDSFKVYLCCGPKGEEQWIEMPFEDAPRGK